MSPFEPKKFGRYVLIDKLAVGGMAEIYKAKTYGVDGFEKLLAIKRILPHCAADSDFVSMLVDEAKLTVLLSHANIVQVYDLGKVGDDYFISMEFIQGTNLRELIRRVGEEEGKIAEELAVYITSEICKGLDYAHRKTDSSGRPLNIVHRDINPQNSLISYEGEVKIVDFGIAKAAMNVSHTMAGVLKGKIAYMSPEQALGKPLDGRTDIYSTGLLLYEMLTGEKLYQGETQFEILNKIRTTRITTQELPGGIPGPLKAILAKALAFNHQRRYQTAGDLHLELTKYLYSSYIDFTPRQLAALVKKHFGADIKATEEEGPVVDEKTRSVIIKEASMEPAGITEPIVHAPVMETGYLPSPSVTTARTIKEKGRRWGLPLLLTIATLGLGYVGWSQWDVGDKVAALWKSVTGPEEIITKPEPFIDYGEIAITSEPRGAAIQIDGKDIGKETPATLKRLPLGKDYSITLQKEHYAPFEKSLALVTEETVTIHGALQPLPEGVLNITSKPSGASIFLDDKDTNKKTPATIDALEIHKEYTVQLKKEGYGEWTSVVPLNSFTPFKLSARLSKLLPGPAKPEIPKLGVLIIESTPNSATVYLNGKDTGKVTPTQLEDLKLGNFYTIKLSKSGYKSWTKSIKVDKESGKTLKASLDTLPKKRKPTVKAKPKPKPRIVAKPPEPRYEPKPTPVPQPTATGKPGKIKIKSSPSGAEVYINAEYKGTTPLTVKEVPSGTAQVVLSKSGYLGYTSAVTVKAGKTKSLGTIKLEGLYGEIKVETSPPRAVVYFNGQRIGARTPVTIRKVPRNRTHLVRVELGGYQNWQTKVDLRKQGTKKYKIVLERN